jgi:hypothetical protein
MISMGQCAWLLRKIGEEYAESMGSVFETYCQQIILAMFPGEYTRIGEWWDKNSEVSA